MYNCSLKYRWDNKNVMDYAVNEAETKGLEKGFEKGKLEKAKEIAREMKKDSFPVEQIAKFTKLSIKDIEKL